MEPEAHSADRRAQPKGGPASPGAATGLSPPSSLNIPNFISLGRVLSVPVVFWLLLSGRYQSAFFLFLAAGISDAIDGWLAKRYSWQTELGAYLDPLADKLLVVCIFVAMGFRGELPSWLVIAVVSRDILIVTGVLLAWLLDHPVTIKPLIVSKANTFAQLLLAAVVLADAGFGLGLVGLREWLVLATGVLTIASLWAYTVTWLRHMTDSEAGD
jgi:cardiolipin synthase (CMP-forming)